MYKTTQYSLGNLQFPKLDFKLDYQPNFNSNFNPNFNPSFNSDFNSNFNLTFNPSFNNPYMAPGSGIAIARPSATQTTPSTTNTDAQSEKQQTESEKQQTGSSVRADILKGLGSNLKNFGQNILNNPELQNQMFGTADNMLGTVQNNSGVNNAFQIGDQIANILPGPAGLIAKGAMFGLKAINSIGGKRADSFSINQDTLEQVGGSYGGSVDTINDAASKAGKKYGMFSSGSRRRANRLIAEAKRQQNIMTDIADEAADQRALAGNDLNYTNYNFNMSGGYDQRYMRAAKHGMKIQDKINLIEQRKRSINNFINLETKKVDWEPVIQYKQGGNVERPWEPIITQQEESCERFEQGGLITENWEPVILELQKGGKTRTLEELIAYAKEQNPRFIQRMSEPLRYVKINFRNNEGEDEWNHATHMMTFTDNIVYPMVQEDPRGQLFIFEDPDKALAWAELNRNVLRFNSPEEAENFAKNYKQGWKEFFNKSPIDINPDSEYEEYEKNKFRLLNLYSKVRSSKTTSQKDDIYPQEYIDFKNSLPDNQKNTPESNYNTYLGWKLYGKPKNFDEAKKLGMYTWDRSDNSYHGNTIAWDEKEGIGYFLKPKHHSTIGYELDWFNKGIITEEGGKQREMTSEERKEWEDFRKRYVLEEDGKFYKYIPIKQSESFKTGGTIKDTLETPEIEETIQKNVIPEGALHKNKHHMEHAEGLTKKGIPVIDEDGDQQAEIELNEIIFTLEVTKKLEELYKKYYSDEFSQREKDEFAIDAGKLLVKEILFNTEDRTGLISKCEKGGILNEVS